MLSTFAKSFVFVNSKIIPGSTVLPRLFSTETTKFETLIVSVPKPYVYHVELNRPQKVNTLNSTMWQEITDCFRSLSDNPSCRVVLFSGQGKHFTGGIDLQSFIADGQKADDLDDIARKARFVSKFIRRYQESVTSLETCIKPVLAIVHNGCIGAGVDLITAADMRYCTQDAWFQVKEVDVGLAADVGTLQRLPKVIGNASIARELCYTARKVQSNEAMEIGLVSKVYPDKDTAIKEVLEIAANIASKSPVAVQTSKQSLVYSQSRPTQDGLDHIALLNQTMLQSGDLQTAAISQLSKSEAEFEDY